MAFEIGGDRALFYQEILCVLGGYGLQERILSEADFSMYTVHPSSTKMHHDLKKMY